jgi:Protein of unknown function DUF262
VWVAVGDIGLAGEERYGMAKLSTILDQIDAGSMLLPEFQRGYVWNRDQVRELMKSLYHGFPVGALLVWETEGSGQAVRGGAATAGQKHLLLDGQQRVTTLYGVIRGQAPSFFEGDPRAFTDLRFNLETEQFQFHAPVKMKDDPLWTDVTAAFRHGEGAVLAQLLDLNWVRPKLTDYLSRLSRLTAVVQRDFHIEQITGADKTVDVVVGIFNRVNSGGTKLSKGDLALARICAEWSDARPAMRRNLDRWNSRGYHFTADWLLRNVNAVATGRAPFAALEDVSADAFQHALHRSLDHIDHFLDLVGSRLGLDHDRVLTGRYGFPVISRLLDHRGGRFADGAEADRALYWYIQAALRGHFVGPTETTLSKELETVEKAGVDGLIANLRRGRRGSLAVTAQDVEGPGRGSRAYPLLYLLTRVRESRDLLTGHVLGTDVAALQVHEIFPKALLYKQGYSRAEVNAVANFAFLTPSAAIAFGKREPEEYLASCHAEALRSQWIPTDPELWKIDNYREFLDARRELLAAAANGLLDALLDGSHPWEKALDALNVVADPEPDARAAQIRSLVEEFTGLGYVEPALDAEIPDPETGRVLAVAEAFWPDGFQPGLGEAVVLELDPEEADIPRLTELGCAVFTSVDALRGYVEQLRKDVEEPTSSDDVVPAKEGLEADGPAMDAAGPFDRAVADLVERCRTELRYHPRHFNVMINQYGALGAVRRLLHAPSVSDGFVTLWERQRLDLSVEALAVDDRFAALFTDEERETARKRLDDFGHGPAAA